MNNLHEHIAALAAENPDRLVLLECDEQGRTVQEISRAVLLQKIDEKIATLKDRTEPLLLEGESRAGFLITCW